VIACHDSAVNVGERLADYTQNTCSLASGERLRPEQSQYAKSMVAWTALKLDIPHLCWRVAMDEKDLQYFKKQLEAIKADINNDVEQTLSEMTSHTGNVPDPNDRASMESDRSFELRIRGRERKLMDKVNEALARIEDGTYGFCAGCGCEIAMKRLRARPVATYCIDCKTSQEQQEKEQGR
jgi:DnaK suppressor protein